MFKKLLAFFAAMTVAVAFAAVDVNKATPAELDGIKGIGPAISGKIVDERKKGNFKDWNDFIERVKGIGEGNAAKFSAEGLTVSGAGYKGAAAAPAKADAKAAAATPATAAAPAKADAKPTTAAAPPAAPAKADVKADAKPAAPAAAAAAAPAMAKEEKKRKTQKLKPKLKKKRMPKQKLTKKPPKTSQLQKQMPRLTPSQTLKLTPPRQLPALPRSNHFKTSVQHKKTRQWRVFLRPIKVFS